MVNIIMIGSAFIMSMSAGSLNAIDIGCLIIYTIRFNNTTTKIIVIIA
jgi:Ni,Fe-hydrogenase III small subunit